MSIKRFGLVAGALVAGIFLLSAPILSQADEADTEERKFRGRSGEAHDRVQEKLKAHREKLQEKKKERMEHLKEKREQRRQKHQERMESRQERHDDRMEHGQERHEEI
ncbi:MAG: hypothetical protein V3U37_03230, partial [Nitrospinaceae bacterium]